MMHEPHSPIPSDKVKLHAVSGVILNEQQQILLFLRDDMPLWTNIGGIVESGEDFKMALHRERFEETGCRIHIGRFVGDFFSPQKDGSYFHEQVYICDILKDEIPIPQPAEGVTLQWFEKSALPVNMGPRFRVRIEHAFLNDHKPAAMIISQDNMVEFLQKTTDFSQFVGMDEWLRHPTVLHKRKSGQLKFDPLSLIK